MMSLSPIIVYVFCYHYVFYIAFYAIFFYVFWRGGGERKKKLEKKTGN